MPDFLNFKLVKNTLTVGDKVNEYYLTVTSPLTVLTLTEPLALPV